MINVVQGNIIVDLSTFFLDLNKLTTYCGIKTIYGLRKVNKKLKSFAFLIKFSHYSSVIHFCSFSLKIDPLRRIGFVKYLTQLKYHNFSF